jgi:hypothetical protein
VVGYPVVSDDAKSEVNEVEEEVAVVVDTDTVIDPWAVT